MDGREGVVLKIDGEWEIRFERRLAHSPPKAWAAITSPGQMSRWFDETHMPEILEVGAVIRFHHAMVDQWSEGLITAMEPEQLIEWLWRGPFEPAQSIRWEIAPEPGGCRLILRQRVDNPATLGRTMAGWHMCLDRLQSVVENRDDSGGPGRARGLFETYKEKLEEMGITMPQLGAPPKPRAKS